MTSNTGDTARNDSVAVGVTAVELLDEANPERPRKFFFIRNNSTALQTITLVFGNEQVPVVGSGVVLNVGDAYFEAVGEGFEPWQRQVYGIASAAAATAGVTER